jgi:type II secretion system protein G
MKRLPNIRGFTLIELMVVVAIVGILMATATLAYNVFIDKAKTVQAMADLKKMQLAIELLASETEKWPGPNNVGETANMEVWDLSAANAGLVATNGAFPGWSGPYIASVPKDPWGSNYFFDPDYRIGGVFYAVIGSFGPNKVGRNRYDSDDLIIKLAAQ